MPDEPDIWWARFSGYLHMGENRIIERLYHTRKATVEPELKGRRASSEWSKKAKEWNWAARAAAYDESLRIEDADYERQQRLKGRQERREIASTYLTKVTKAIDKADIENMDVIAARMYLQVLVVMLTNMLKAHRLEHGEPTEIQSATIGTVELNADVLAEAQRQLMAFREEQRQEDENEA